MTRSEASLLHSSWNSPGRSGLLANVAVALGTIVIINFIVFACGLTKYPESVNPSFAPPSVVVAAVWFALFVLHGVARWSLSGDPSPRVIRLKNILVAIFLINATYPIYTAGFRLSIPAFIGTVIPLSLTVYVMRSAWNVNRVTSLLLTPMALWFCYAALITASVLGWLPLR